MKKIKNITNTKVNVRISEQTSTNHLKPIFSLEYLEGKYCLSKCENNLKVQFVNRLHSLSKSSWQELQQLNRHKKGYELMDTSIVKISKPHIFTEELKYVIFHTSCNHSVIGVRLQQIFYVLGIDYDFTAYEHN